MVEVALVLPVALLLLGGALDLGRLFFARVSIENAAREGAVFAASNPRCDTASRSDCADPDTADWRVRNEVSGLTGLATTFTCLDGATVRANVEDCEAGDTYVVTVADQFDLVTPILTPLMGSSLTLEASATARVLNSAFDPNAPFETFPEGTAGPTATPAPSGEPTAAPTGSSCDVPDLVGTKVNSGSSVWLGAGFTGSYTNGGGNGNYSIGWQSLTPGMPEACSSSITVMKDAP